MSYGAPSHWRCAKYRYITTTCLSALMTWLPRLYTQALDPRAEGEPVSDWDNLQWRSPRCLSYAQHFWTFGDRTFCRRRTTSLKQSAAQSQTTRAVIRPVQAVAEDIFIRTVWPRRSVNCFELRRIEMFLLTCLIRFFDNYCRATTHSAAYATARCPSVRLSVRHVFVL